MRTSRASSNDAPVAETSNHAVSDGPCGERSCAVGATLALPFLEACCPRSRTRAGGANCTSSRHVPNGAGDGLLDAKGGGGVRAVPILGARALQRPDARAVGHQSQLELRCRRVGIVSPARPRQTKRDQIFADVSMDQLLARTLRGRASRLVELSMDAPANAGACTGNLSASMRIRFSAQRPPRCRWVESARGLRAAVRRQRQHGSHGARGQAAAAQSILDSVAEKLASLKRDLGPGSVKVDRFAGRFATWSAASNPGKGTTHLTCRRSRNRKGAPPVFEISRAMLDLQLLAFQSDLRASSRSRSARQSARPCPQIGVPERTIASHPRHPQARRADVEDQPLSHAAVPPISGQAARDAPATARSGPHDDPVRRGHLDSQRHSGNLPFL